MEMMQAQQQAAVRGEPHVRDDSPQSMAFDFVQAVVSEQMASQVMRRQGGPTQPSTLGAYLDAREKDAGGLVSILQSPWNSLDVLDTIVGYFGDTSLIMDLRELLRAVRALLCAVPISGD